jgi:hypothetical protein
MAHLNLFVVNHLVSCSYRNGKLIDRLRIVQVSSRPNMWLVLCTCDVNFTQ